MTGTGAIAVDLQSPVDRFSRSLEIPQRLIALHPRAVGGSGNAAALAPAATLSVIAAFEGFVEEFLATLLYLQGNGLAQIAKKVTGNNPTVAQFERKVTDALPSLRSRAGEDFEVRVWNIPRFNGRPATETIGWHEASRRADGWMEVRHCLSHGLVSGWRSEVWPPSLKGSSTVSASSVLRERAGGKHSIGLHQAISCARIYTSCARHLAELAAAELGEQLAWSGVPEFSLAKQQ